MNSSVASGARNIIRKSVIIYIDGACSRNGQAGARAGIGVYWPDNEANNISQPLDGHPSNQRAEIVAALKGISQARIQGYTDITVKTDSYYVKHAAESWISNWIASGWRRPVKNRDDFMNLWESMQGLDVRFEYIPSGFNLAHPLARNGVKKLDTDIVE